MRPDADLGLSSVIEDMLCCRPDDFADPIDGLCGVHLTGPWPLINVQEE
jgi:hypothetical protein